MLKLGQHLARFSDLLMNTTVMYR